MATRRTLLTRASVLLGMALAPVAALCAPGKRIDLAAMNEGNWRAAERECDMLREANASAWRSNDYILADNELLRVDLREARALLAEARGHLHGCNGGTDFPLHTSIVERIDKAVGRGAGREGQG